MHHAFTPAKNLVEWALDALDILDVGCYGDNIIYADCECTFRTSTPNNCAHNGLVAAHEKRVNMFLVAYLHQGLTSGQKQKIHLQLADWRKQIEQSLLNSQER